jgi:spore germination cell wall hydrolase CwlJ-like protein
MTASLITTLLFLIGCSEALADSPTPLADKKQAKELRCLALNVYFEARGETAAGQLAVALVTMNRVKSRRYPATVCGVVWQPHQFSWTHDGKSDRPKDARAWKLAQKIAYFVYKRFNTLSIQARRALDLTKGALHYYAPQLAQPYWAEAQEVTRAIGGHVFLRGRS